MSEPEQIKPVVDEIMAGLKNARVMSIRDSWHALMGKEIAKHSVPAVVRDGKLFVFVDSSAWLQHLSIKKGDMLKKLDSFSIREIILKYRDLNDSDTKQGKVN